LARGTSFIADPCDSAAGSVEKKQSLTLRDELVLPVTIPREELERKYWAERKSLREIAHESGHDLKTIIKLFKALRISRRSLLESWAIRRERLFPAEQTLRITLDYLKNRRSLTSLERDYGIPRHTLAALLRRTGVALRSPGDYLRGRSKSAEHRKRISSGRKAMLRRRPDLVESIRQHRLRQVLPKKDALIERLVERELRLRRITFHKHLGVEGVCIPDFTFPESKLAVFCDGDYWHRRPDARQKDARVNRTLRERGWTVSRFWERDIKNNPRPDSKQNHSTTRRSVHGCTPPEMEKTPFAFGWRGFPQSGRMRWKWVKKRRKRMQRQRKRRTGEL
jgi:very-short-patch-repair endonuclease